MAPNESLESGFWRSHPKVGESKSANESKAKNAGACR
jgi:hypothetical protein